MDEVLSAMQYEHARTHALLALQLLQAHSKFLRAKNVIQIHGGELWAVQRQTAIMSKKGQKMDLGTFLGASRGPALSNLPSGPDPNREYVALYV
jgi:hypothetical protein